MVEIITTTQWRMMAQQAGLTGETRSQEEEWRLADELIEVGRGPDGRADPPPIVGACEAAEEGAIMARRALISAVRGQRSYRQDAIEWMERAISLLRATDSP